MKKQLLLFTFSICLFSFSYAQVTEEWTEFFNYEGNNTDEPADMVVDINGNVYITGFTTTNVRDIITLKYNKNGVLQWSQFYDGPMNNNDIAHAITVDNSGNVYVIGDSQTQTWTDLTILKYDPDGAPLWIQYYDNNGSDGGYDIEVGENGMIYAVGYSNTDIITLQYNPDGELQWASTYNGSENSLDIGFALVLDEQSNVYVTGYSKNIGTSRDITTIKYNAQGVEQWVSVYDGPGHLSDEGQKIARDQLNNIYVLGYSNDENSKPQFATLKYDISGNQLWVNRYFNPETMRGTPGGLVVYNSDNIYVCGTIGKGYATVKINFDGDTVWTRQYGIYSNDQMATDIISDEAGNIYVTGWTRIISGNLERDYGTVKYNPEGVLKWDIRYESPEGGLDDALKVGLDAENNVFVTGKTTTVNAYDIGTIKYSQLETGIKDDAEIMAFDVYPNPFSTETVASYRLQLAAYSELKVFDVNGYEVATLVNQKQMPGEYNVKFDSKGLLSGTYYLYLSVGSQKQTKKIILVK